MEQTLARRAHEVYTEGLLAHSAQATATAAARAEAKIAAVDAQFEEYISSRDQQPQEQVDRNEQQLGQDAMQTGGEQEYEETARDDVGVDGEEDEEDVL